MKGNFHLMTSPNERENLVPRLRKKLDTKKLDTIHRMARYSLLIKFKKVKSSYDRKVRDVVFSIEEKVWLFNPRRIKRKAPKFQRNWEGLYKIVRRLNDVVYCIQISLRHRKKVVHADRLVSYRERKVGD